MRTFKFRAWEDGVMYYQVRCGGEFDGIPTAPTAWDDDLGDWVNLTGQPHTKIMQYIGVKDNNGKEIYDGDIVLISCPHDDSAIISEVTYGGEEYPAFDLPNYDGYGMNGFAALHFSDDEVIEVIGNIYEDPELLLIK